MTRRGVVLGAAAALALAAGAGWQWRRGADGADGSNDMGAGGTGSGGDGGAGSGANSGAADLWAQQYPTPSGGVLALAERRGRPLLLNFWATWCPPCLKEMPALDRFHQRYAARGWQVVGLAVDKEAPVRDYLRRVPVGYAIGIAGFDGAELARRLGNGQGALPFTAAFDTRGNVVQRKLGECSDDQLTRWGDTIG